MKRKTYQVSSVSKTMQSYVEKNYESLKEDYLRKGYDSKILFVNYCIQMFEKDFTAWESKMLMKEVVENVEF